MEVAQSDLRSKVGSACVPINKDILLCNACIDRNCSLQTAAHSSSILPKSSLHMQASSQSTCLLWHLANLWSVFDFGVPVFFADFCLAFAHSCSTPYTFILSHWQRATKGSGCEVPIYRSFNCFPFLLNFIHFMLLSSCFIPVPSPLLQLLHLSLKSLSTQQCFSVTHIAEVSSISMKMIWIPLHSNMEGQAKECHALLDWFLQQKKYS